MRPHKIPARIVLKSYGHPTPSAVKFPLNKSVKENNKMKVKMSQRQLEYMMDGNTSESLKTLIKKVTELQSSKQFENLIPKRREAEIAGRRDPLQIVKSKIPAVHESKLAEETREIVPVPASTLKIENISSNTDHTVANWLDSIKKMVAPLKLRLTKIWDNDVRSNFHGVDYLNGNVIKSSLFPFRVGFGKSSNVGIMRPIQNWSPSPTGDRRSLTTTANLMKGEGGDCKKKGALPCLKVVSNGPPPSAGEKKLCEKMCMPCCPPARDPPHCVIAQKRKPCQKYKPPRPAYSECKKDKVKSMRTCECTIDRLPPCGLNGESKQGDNC